MLNVEELRARLVEANKDYSFREIAEWCDITHATLHYFSKNERTPTYANLLKINKGLAANDF